MDFRFLKTIETNHVYNIIVINNTLGIKAQFKY